jgi:hypothetical protein
VLKTQLNHLLALQKLFAWIEFNVQGRVYWKGLYQKRNIKTLLRERKEWLERQIKVIKPAATQESIDRNDRESLEESGRWLDLKDLLKVDVLLCLLPF